MSFANSKRQPRRREKQRSLLAIEARASRQTLGPVHADDMGNKLFHKMKVTGQRTAEFITKPLEAVHDIQHACGRKVRSHIVGPTRADSVQNRGLFRNTRATGSRCVESITKPLQAMRELNPSFNARFSPQSR
jgi:hypothetical protein